MIRVLIALFLFPLGVAGQSFTLDVHAGLSGYQGDLQAKRFSLQKINPAIGLGGSWYIKPQIVLRGLGTITNIEASDRAADGTLNNPRNLHFRSRILEAQIVGEYHFFKMDEKGFTPYIFAGLAAFKFDPYTKTVDGQKIMLRELGTEGQNLPQYPDVKEYKNTQMAIPFGFGILAPISSKINIGFEFSLRKLFTDYLDDVSGFYADSTILASTRGPLAAQMAYRGNEEMGNPPYPVAGSQRGNPGNKDWYYTTTLRLSYAFKMKDKTSKFGSTGCPTF